MKFAHLGDCHLDGWRQPELKSLNLQSFQKAIQTCLQQKVEFILIAGDLFDSAYPSIEILKHTFNEFRKLKESKIPVFLIAGSHDYSVSGKTFLDVLEKSGFCKNVVDYEEKNNSIILHPTNHKNIAIYGYPGKKSCLETEEIKKIKLQDSPGLFKILLLHTAIKDAIGTAPINSVDESLLPEVDYLALGHLHINYSKNKRVYSGPIFPNNISELEELKSGSFYIFNNGVIKQHRISLKEVVSLNLEITNSLTATEKILQFLENQEVKDKIIIVRVSGILEKGKITDIDFQKIESFLKEKQAFVFLKTTSKLHLAESEIKLDSLHSETLEEQILDNFKKNNPNKFNSIIPEMIKHLSIEKLEDETNSTFENRLLSEIGKVLPHEN